MLERLEKDSIKLLARLLGRINAVTKLKDAFIEAIKVRKKERMSLNEVSSELPRGHFVL